MDVEVKGGSSNPLLRVYIDKEGGVSHADCQRVSEQMSAILDVEDPFPGSYLLEVSSPGLERALVKETDYERFKGRKARIALKEPVAGRKVLEGVIAGCESGRVKLDLGAEGAAQVDLANVTKAKLVLDW